MSDSSCVIAIDLGGTKVIGAIAGVDGTILAELAEPTSGESPVALLDQLRALVRRLAGEAGVPSSAVRALSVGVPGTIDPVSGEILLAHNIPDMNGTSLAEELGSDGGPRVLVENDVNAAALGERWLGLARDCDQFAFVAVGTGIAAGLVVDGALRRGRRGAAGEIGYLPIGEDPFEARVRRRGALEEAVAGRGIVADVERRLAAGTGSELTSGCTAADVFAAAERGDRLALLSIDREARLIGMAIASIASVVAPEMVVLGGGIGANELLLKPVREYTEALTAQPLRVESSGLGPRAALIGALAIGLEALGVAAPSGADPQPARVGG